MVVEAKELEDTMERFGAARVSSASTLPINDG